MYIVIEIQSNSDGTVGTLVNSYEQRSTAEQKYHQVLAAAAVSNLPKHGALMMTDAVNVIKCDCYYAENPGEEVEE